MKTLRLVSAALALAVCSAWGGVLPPGATVAGKTAGEWTADFWKWVYSQPTNSSAHLDCTGRFATNGQPAGIVFFVPSVNGLSAEACVRTFIVPENKYLLVPLLAISIDNINTEPPYTSDGQAGLLTGVLGLATGLRLELDGIIFKRAG